MWYLTFGLPCLAARGQACFSFYYALSGREGRKVQVASSDSADSGGVSQGGRLVIWVPLLCGGVAVLLSSFLLLVVPVREALGGWAWGVVAIGFSGFLGALFSWRNLSIQELDIKKERQGLEIIRRELASEMGQLEVRRQRFERRLLTYGEWMEFPDEGTAPVPEKPEQAEAVRAQDEAVARIVRERSESLLERFRSEDFLVDGTFSAELLMREAGEFLEDIARVYQPGVTSPILETNVEKLLQAINRLSMQLLFQIEQLPINLKDYSLARMAEHVRTASRFYGYYQSLQPYLPIANYTWQLGRVVAGTNPLTAGTLFLGSEALRRGGKRVGKFYLERYSLKLTQEAVRLLGNEAATVFDPGYRHRDSSWIYGVELAELVHAFAPSVKTLEAAFQELGALPLRGSYDRVYLYRCLAAHASPEPHKFGVTGHLSSTERHEIARRLEVFFERHAHGRHPERVQGWAKGVEERLGVAMRVVAGRVAISPAEEALAMVQSLAGFLVEIRGHEPGALEALLKKTESWKRWQGIAGKEGAVGMQDEPWPSLFGYPEIAEDSHLLRVFFNDLLDLERKAETVDPVAFIAISEVARFLGAPENEVEEPLSEIYGRRLGKRLLSGERGERRVPGSLAVALAEILPPGENVDLLYCAEFDGSKRHLRGGPMEGANLWLVGAGSQCWVLAEQSVKKKRALPGAGVAMCWAARAGEFSVSMDARGGFAVIEGGNWRVPVSGAGGEIEGAGPAGFKVVAPKKRWGRGASMAEAGAYFDALRAVASKSSNRELG